ncbi:5'-methylthioadenosine/S-adenosylhomocysteine nucleosidase family protein [Planktothrix agardhii]|jgi:purine-nucleoside phosphorylase|uniref:5'-methylthioadenosine/S-adenosylhomocysteine nucleosidase family protein n=1 Tax=Planktothrix agardhii TaxID=1160 RepID=UPI001D0B1FF2|nr:phosphorylase [Planktothrix agardhii]MCB8751008.1 phosphorylase [Planktothrix agardhii 1810]
MAPFNFILVPQGQEYRAVLKGLQLVESLNIQVLPIPIGSEYLSVYLKKWLNSEAINNQSLQVLIMGLCGSLSPNLKVGDIVIYQNCLPLMSKDFGEDPKDMTFPWDYDLALFLHQKLISSHLVRGLTTDRVITTATEKQKLSQLYPVEVVDMEGLILLESLTKAGIKAAMVRVVSDDFSQDLPDLTPAIDHDGRLKIFPLIKVLLQHPVQGLKLISSGLKSLAILQQLTQKLQLLN